MVRTHFQICETHMSNDEIHEGDHQSGEIVRLCVASLVLSFQELEAQHVELERVG